jgi:hypothetical protein
MSPPRKQGLRRTEPRANLNQNSRHHLQIHTKAALLIRRRNTLVLLPGLRNGIPGSEADLSIQRPGEPANWRYTTFARPSRTEFTIEKAVDTDLAGVG